MSHEQEISELILYVTDMRRKFNIKLDDHLFIIQRQNERIERQNQILNEQREVIDELAWQIRDLRDAVRQCNENKSMCVCNYENHEPKYKRNYVAPTNPSIHSTGRDRSHTRLQIEEIEEVDEEDESIYEAIEHVEYISNKLRSSPTAEITTLKSELNEEKPAVPKYSEVVKNRLKQNVLDEIMDNKRTTRYVRPTLPATALSQSTSILKSNSDTNVKSKLHQQPYPLNVNLLNDALSKLNHLHTDDVRDSIDSIDSIDEDNIMFRNKEIKKFSSNSQRGSSKVMCSMISDIDAEYLPEDDEIDNDNTVLRNVVSDAMVEYASTIIPDTTQKNIENSEASIKPAPRKKLQ